METKLLEGKEAIRLGAKLIKEGKIVVFPTETVYGLGADAFNKDAVKQIFIAKGRPSDNPLIVHISDKTQIPLLVDEISDKAQKLIDNFMPGPITIIMKKKNCIPNEVSGGLNTVGIRMPSHPIAREFIKAANTPIAAPSANISTHISPTRSQDVYEDMNGRVPLIIEGGSCEVGIESTIVDVSQDVPTILRPGGITSKMIASVLGAVATFKGEVIVAKAPGMKYKHYAPSCDMVVAESIDSIINTYKIKENELKKPIVLCKDDTSTKLDNIRFINLGKNEDEVMKNIFIAMHEAQKISKYIICEDFGSEGKFASIMNRVNKASAGVRV